MNIFLIKMILNNKMSSIGGKPL